MIKNAEDGLKKLEEKFSEHPDNEDVFNIFIYEEMQTDLVKSQGKDRVFWKRFYSYSNCFRMVFTTFGWIGAGAAVCALVKAVS